MFLAPVTTCCRVALRTGAASCAAAPKAEPASIRLAHTKQLKNLIKAFDCFFGFRFSAAKVAKKRRDKRFYEIYFDK
jgi:hypothetical protein